MKLMLLALILAAGRWLAEAAEEMARDDRETLQP